MSRLRLVRHLLSTTGGGSSVTYDTSIGNGVDSAGFADLPLYAGGTTGSDVITGSPSSTGAGITYTSGTRTLSGTIAGGNNLATWTAILTPGQLYRVELGIIRASYVKVHIKDENGNVLWDMTDPRGYSGSGNESLFFDTTFTAVGHDFILYVDNDAFTTGAQVRIGVLAPQTGNVPAHRFYVANGGSDTINPIAALNPATPLATLAQAALLVTPGAGDQILVAEGSSFSAGFPLLDIQSGRSATYPFVIQSYPPSDPTNEAKLGRAAGANRPQIGTGLSGPNTVTNTSSAISYLAIRGFNFNPPDANDPELDFLGNTSQSTDYVLIENNILAHSGLGVDLSAHTAAPGQHWVIRNNAMYGLWAASGHVQMLYVGSTQYLTIEDNVLWHGWEVGASRDDPTSAGGLVGDQVFRHSCYIQNTCRNIIYRRNLVIDGNADGGHILGDCVATENLIIDAPIALDCTGGVGYETVRPTGVDIQISYNAIIGSADLTSTDPRSLAIWTRNGSSGSSVHHNVIARASNASGSGRNVFSTTANFGKPSYCDYHDNVAYLWSASGNTHTESTDGLSGSDVHASYENNLWDDPSDGNGNTSNSGHVFPNAYSAASLYTAAGYADKTALINYAIANPEQHPQRAVYNLFMAGYGISHSI